MADASSSSTVEKEENKEESSSSVAAVTPLSRTDLIIGSVILIGAQLCAASTATCVHALPAQTPSVLRGLWRQTLTSMIFSVLTLILLVLSLATNHNSRQGRKSKSANGRASWYEDEEGEQARLISDEEQRPPESSKKTPPSNDSSNSTSPSQSSSSTSSATRIALVAFAVIGATLLNDTIVVALQYASSAAVMCLCNTTPIWLILYAIVHCGATTPGRITILGATLSLVGAIVCATTPSGNDNNEGGGHEKESLGAMIATVGGIGGAIYMTACRKLAPVGINPIVLTLIINIGMTLASLLLCLTTLPDGVSIFSTDLTNGFFGFINPEANPAALLHSVFPDCGGNFGIMLALSYFEPLIVSMIMLTEPLNASLIAMKVVNEAPPSQQTVFGVAIVLFGCAVVLWESSKEGKEMDEIIEREEEVEVEGEMVPLRQPRDDEERKSVLYRRRTSQSILFSPIGTIAPDVTAKAAFHRPSTTALFLQHRHHHHHHNRRQTLPVSVIRDMSLSDTERSSSIDNYVDYDTDSSRSRRFTVTGSILRTMGQRLSFTSMTAGGGSEARGSISISPRTSMKVKRYGAMRPSSIQEWGEEEEEE